MATIFRVPLETRRVVRPPVGPPAAPPSLLTTTLASADQFFGAAGQGPAYDWPNPHRRRALGITEPVINLLHGPLQPLPIGSIVFELPQPRLKLRQADSLSNLLLTTLQSQDAFFGAVAPAFDWPNPIQVKRKLGITDQVSSFLVTTLQGQDVFFGAGGPTYDWPNPKRLRRDDLTWTSSLPLPFDGGEMPVGQSVNHQLKKLPGPGVEPALSILLTTLAEVSGVPFFQSEWLNPKRLRRDDLTFISTLPTPFSAGAAVPFVQAEWPNPAKHHAVPLPSEYADVLNLLLSPPVERFPFVPRDPSLAKPLRLFVDMLAEITNSLIRNRVLVRTGESTWAIMRSRGIAAERPPSVNDDAAHGYSVSQIWVDTATDAAYVCVSVTNGAAVWRQIS